jgi:hypothetical protein
MTFSEPTTNTRRRLEACLSTATDRGPFSVIETYQKPGVIRRGEPYPGRTRGCQTPAEAVQVIREWSEEANPTAVDHFVLAPQAGGRFVHWDDFKAWETRHVV